MKYRKDGRPCIQCGKPLPSNCQKYCSYECVALHRQERWRSFNPFKGRTSATTGAISELIVAVDLMTKSYDVFRALSPSCPCDLAVLKNDHLLRVEVKTAFSSTSGKVYGMKDKRDDTRNIDHYALVLAGKVIYEPPLE